MLLFSNAQTIAEEMRPTDALRTGGVVGAPQAVMHRSPSLSRQHPDGVDRFLAPLPMPLRERQPAGCMDRKPMQQPVDPRSGVIHMIQLLDEQHARDLLHRWSTRASGFLKPPSHRPLGDRAMPQVGHGLRHAFHRQELGR